MASPTGSARALRRSCSCATSPIRPFAHSPKPIVRRETASLLWPEASRANALAYLRRAVMELREAGIDVVATQDDLSIEPNAVLCEMNEPSRAVLEGVEHPVADEIRRVAARLRLAAT